LRAVLVHLEVCIRLASGFENAQTSSDPRFDVTHLQPVQGRIGQYVDVAVGNRVSTSTYQASPLLTRAVPVVRSSFPLLGGCANMMMVQALTRGLP
jgi:hypothetical protein